MGDPWARARSQTSKQNSQCISVVVGVSVIFWDFSSAGFPLQLDSRCRGMLCVSKSFPQDGQALLTVCDDGLDFVLEGFTVVGVSVSSGLEGPSAGLAAIAAGVWLQVWISG